jgi:hypothetical protein
MATQLGRYEIRKELGRGGMATVYLGYDPQFKREVAVKVLPPQFTHDPSFFSRFEQEAKTIAQLEHTAIVPVYDYGRQGDHPYFVMRLMAGGDLRAAIQQGPIPLPQVAQISRRICAALDKAHNRGIVHRDIKPSNILFDDDGYAYLADFGIVRLAEMTHTVTMIGTPEYMTPEQIRGEGVDGRSDIYQMGVVIFEMLTGRQPFRGENTAALLYKHAHEPAPALRDLNADLPAACEDVIQHALAKKPADRFATAGDLAVALEAALHAPDMGRRVEGVTTTAVSPPQIDPIPIKLPPADTRPSAAQRLWTRILPGKPQREAGAEPSLIVEAALPATAVQPRTLTKEGRWLAKWILANALGWTLATIVSQLVVTAFDYYGYYYELKAPLVAISLSLVWSTAQWLALRAYLPISGLWILLTTLAFSVPGLLSILYGYYGLYWYDLVMGILLGGAQWLLLRHRVAWAWVWVPAVVVAMLLNRWIANFWYGKFGDYYWELGHSLEGSIPVVQLINGAVWAAVTGVTLIGLVSLGQKREKHIEETAR